MFYSIVFTTDLNCSRFNVPSASLLSVLLFRLLRLHLQTMMCFVLKCPDAAQIDVCLIARRGETHVKQQNNLERLRRKLVNRKAISPRQWQRARLLLRSRLSRRPAGVYITYPVISTPHEMIIKGQVNNPPTGPAHPLPVLNRLRTYSKLPILP